MNRTQTDTSNEPKPLRVLIVEDSADDAVLILREIRKGGWIPSYLRVDEADPMRRALADQSWDIILSDYWMPRFDGLQALAVLSESKLDIPLIIISGAIGEESAVAVLKSGAADFISKGNLSRLNPAIERELREAAARRELRDAERRLKESEERLRLLIDGVQEYAIFMLDEKARVVSWNSGAQRIMGYQASEIIGQPLFIFFSPEDVRQGKDDIEIKTARDTGRFEGEGWHIRKDGVFIWTHVINSALHDDDGKIIGFSKVVRDITKQKLVEEQLQRSTDQIRELSGHLQTAREEERTEIAREIHDELGQLLTVLKFDLAHLAKKPSEDPAEDKSRLKGAIETVDTAIQSVRKIITELRPGLLDDIGLLAAIEWHAQEFERRTGIKCDVILPSGHITLERNRSTAVFRIFQEILTNVAKHAQATVVDIIVSTGDEGILLEVKDNGLGITEENLNKANSFGVAGMRERLRRYDGRMEVTGSPGQGTTVTVEIPYQ